ncbi:hypothetical protein [Sodalis endosymbiont of Henestaris halophilus]|uniref:hypothetical protein n=1 Tax=Sodalis endosymbiont of Henestaris halophilus TaxID=1929246 RepID=UPI000BC08852|nr:hypothetical protein [Sodalis endosymbiont of Henestaris halophilus]SNC58620.1 hypothetical protein HBA_0363 [Sodalis endosymbiont of Henestaris halophilus]
MKKYRVLCSGQQIIVGAIVIRFYPCIAISFDVVDNKIINHIDACYLIIIVDNSTSGIIVIEVNADTLILSATFIIKLKCATN